MNPIQMLIAALAPLGDTHPAVVALTALGADVTAASTEQVQAALDAVRALAADDSVDLNLDALAVAADVADLLLADVGRRETEATETAEQRQALLDRITAQEDPDAQEDEDDPATEEEVDEEIVEQVPVLASAAPRVSLRPVRAPVIETPSTSSTLEMDGQEVDTKQVASAILDRVRSFTGNHTGSAQRIPVASIRQPFARRMSNRDPAHNDAIIRERLQVFGQPKAVLASGGLCGPSTPIYDQPVLAGAGRPIRDGLPTEASDRGSVSISPATVFPGDSADGVTIWTNTTDTTPGGATKDCLIVECPTNVTTNVQAIVRCLRVGNFQERFNPERVEGFLGNLTAFHAQSAELELLTAIDAASTAVSSGAELGTARDILTHLGRTASIYRNRNRMDPTADLTVIVPTVARDAIRADLIMQMPGDDALVRADAEIDGYLNAHNLSPIWSPDAFLFGAQNAGVLLTWPTTYAFRVFAPGTFLFLDGGELNMGPVRDSVLNATNDLELFAETFEGLIPVGHPSYKLTLTVCTSGASAATVTNDCAS